MIEGKLQGQFFDKTSIHVINQSNENGVNSDFEGNFKIEVMLGDTLIISSVQYERVKRLITSEIINKKEIIIDLRLQVNELDEVLLSNISLSGNLMLDFDDIETIDKSEFGLSYVEERTRTEKKLQAANRNVFASIFNSFSGKTNQLETIHNIEEKRNLIDRAINAVPKTLFKDLNLPDNLIKDFIYFCAENPNFHLLVAKERHLELVEYYQMKAPKFLARRE
ncbi:carboxypeptidase-like regulatory domain-containing protein [Salegentibacter sp. LM13S]|uniref:carboxypeptidase-like regulatory domain-containing protein n=1 Tax=Salegentibacter lacus TaxID=2873599 RepID=UPI001CCC573B|nr:carboxypeptidase-like regulatory domain-containing protein [Salegentibacter lacus]MBZ9631585.1 carboxypeptidase-like regulatory domain-containing protein [Salegentibacter lacus]